MGIEYTLRNCNSVVHIQSVFLKPSSSESVLLTALSCWFNHSNDKGYMLCALPYVPWFLSHTGTYTTPSTIIIELSLYSST